MKRNRARMMRWLETVQQQRGEDQVRAKTKSRKQSPGRHALTVEPEYILTKLAGMVKTGSQYIIRLNINQQLCSHVIYTNRRQTRGSVTKGDLSDSIHLSPGFFSLSFLIPEVGHMCAKSNEWRCLQCVCVVYDVSDPPWDFSLQAE